MHIIGSQGGASQSPKREYAPPKVNPGVGYLQKLHEPVYVVMCAWQE